jgi:hypothetical protein
MHIHESEKYIEEKIQNLFTYHPANDVELRRFEEIRECAKQLARAIYRNGGHNRKDDISLSIQKLRECVFFAIASIVVPI